MFNALNVSNSWNIPQGHMTDACFNCGDPDHGVPKCPKPLDQARIDKNKAEFSRTRGGRGDRGGRDNGGRGGQGRGRRRPGRDGLPVGRALAAGGRAAALRRGPQRPPHRLRAGKAGRGAFARRYTV